jgi:hypothetical protein
MSTNDEQLRTELLSRIAARREIDERWRRLNFFWGQVSIWAAIVSSFGTAIAAATNQLPHVLIAIFAAIPGGVILIERSVGLNHRAKWFSVMVAKAERLEYALRFEGASVESISRDFSEMRVETEKSSPLTTTDGESDGTSRRLSH